MSTDLSELTCPDCGARDQREAFCDSCGAALTRAKPAPVTVGAAAFDESPAEDSAPDSAESSGPSRSPKADPGASQSPVPSPKAESGASQSTVPSQRDSSTASANPVASMAANPVASFADRIAASESTSTSTSAPTSAQALPTSPAPEPQVADEADTVPLVEVARAAAEKAQQAAREQADAERAERARALLVPVADQSAPTGGILPVLPGKPEPIAPQRKGSDRLEALDAGIECQWCATRNPPERHFCRRCGQRLAYAPVEARRPSWWRRLIFFWRNRPLPYAGQRPRLRRGPGQAIRPVVWTAVGVVAVVVVVQEYKPASTNVRDHFAKPNEISNWTITASHEDPNHAAKLLHDTYSDTWWGSGFAPQNSNGTSLTVTFTQPVNLLDMGLTPGAGTAADTFGAQGSPETVDAVLIPIPGKGDPVRKTFTLDDQPGFQKLQLRGDDIRQVVLTITSSYEPTSANPPKAVETAITELEFYTRH
ncbi:hypothetical protein ABH920_005559 [Catenulispora sp. EB89]|uniref:NADase-type glycan-binding domain-containing protein n=1 Tax=Catenulispora sp. EB89 TaxID=3156257 RepID=UPI0035175A77